MNRMHIGQENALKDRVKKIETLLNTLLYNCSK